MPVVTIRSLPPAPDVDLAAVLAEVAANVARAMGAPPRSVWATWSEIAPGLYVEGDEIAIEQPRATHAPLAEIVALEGRTQEQVDAALVAVADALVKGFGLEPGNAFVTYRAMPRGTVYSGGAVRR